MRYAYIYYIWDACTKLIGGGGGVQKGSLENYLFCVERDWEIYNSRLHVKDIAFNLGPMILDQILSFIK